jgi:hypothetical protein
MCGQSADADPVTGDRKNVSFPLTGYSPNTTKWYTNISELPGADRGIPGRGYKTTYDRVTGASASTVTAIPLYNYLEHLGRSKHFLGTYIGFENDGMFTGYSGCSHYEYVEMSKFQSTEANKAHLFGAVDGIDRCPVGKFGFDPRCRGWYAEGRDHGKNGGAVHITAPYLFSTGLQIAQSATSSIFHPVTGQHVGQTLLDFIPQGIFSKLENTESEISVVVSPVADASGGDTVFGPGHLSGADPAPIGDVVLKNDRPDSANRKMFDDRVVAPMKLGQSGQSVFQRIESDGTQKEWSISYAPVNVRTLKAVQADDVTRGVEFSMEFVYSVGIAFPNADLELPFQNTKREVKAQHRRLLTIYLCLVLILAVIVSIFTWMVSF